MKQKLLRLLPILVIAFLGSIPFFGFLLSDKMLYGSDQIGGFGNFVQYQSAIRHFSIPVGTPGTCRACPPSTRSQEICPIRSSGL